MIIVMIIINNSHITITPITQHTRAEAFLPLTHICLTDITSHTYAHTCSTQLAHAKHTHTHAHTKIHGIIFVIDSADADELQIQTVKEIFEEITTHRCKQGKPIVVFVLFSVVCVYVCLCVYVCIYAYVLCVGLSTRKIKPIL